ncbi:lysophospholipid acyltransferase family protein [Spirochaetota bacterium]
MGISLEVEGQDKFDHTKQYIVMGNHESLFDIFAVPVTIPFRFVAVEAAQHFSYPLWGSLVRRWGNIPIDRENLKKAKTSLEIAKNVTDSGTSILIMPEGQRTLTGKVQDFKKGPFHFALAAKKDILPFAMRGLYKYKSKHSWILNPGKVYIKFGTPVSYKSMENLSVEELRDKVKNIIIDLKKSIK